MPRSPLFFLLAVSTLGAQAPLLMDEAERLRREEIHWALPQRSMGLQSEVDEPLLTIREAGLMAVATPQECWTPLSNA